MGCSLTIVRPEHKVLDCCIEIGRLAALPDDQTDSSSNGSSQSSSTSSLSSREIEYLLKEEFALITNISKSCEILPQYCLREVRHAVETLHFRKPDVALKLSKVTDNTINAVKQKTLSLSTAYSCVYSPNDGMLKLNIAKFQNQVWNDQIAISNPATITAFNVDNQSSVLVLSNPSKTPSSKNIIVTAPSTPVTDKSPRNNPNTERSRRNSCPTTPSSINRSSNGSSSPQKPVSPKRFVDGTDDTNLRVRLRSLDGKEIPQHTEYGFYHEEDNSNHS